MVVASPPVLEVTVTIFMIYDIALFLVPTVMPRQTSSGWSTHEDFIKHILAWNQLLWWN